VVPVDRRRAPGAGVAQDESPDAIVVGSVRSDQETPADPVVPRPGPGAQRGTILLDRVRSALFHHPETLLLIFCVCLVAGNATRLHEWGTDGFRVYLTQAIMQTTLFDFAWILAVLAVFLDDDARKVGVRWWWILPTFPFMPTVGVLLYLVARKRALRARGLPLA
jgi:hypothetical protein